MKKIIILLILLITINIGVSKTISYTTTTTHTVNNNDFTGNFADEWLEHNVSDYADNCDNFEDDSDCSHWWCELSGCSNTEWTHWCYGSLAHGWEASTITQEINNGTNIGTYNLTISMGDDGIGNHEVEWGFYDSSNTTIDSCSRSWDNTGQHNERTSCVKTLTNEPKYIFLKINQKCSPSSAMGGITDVTLTSSTTTYYSINITSPTNNEQITTSHIPLKIESNITINYLRYYINSSGTNQSLTDYCETIGGEYKCEKDLYGLEEGCHEITILTKGGNTSVTACLELLDAPSVRANWFQEIGEDKEGISCEFTKENDLSIGRNRIYRITWFEETQGTQRIYWTVDNALEKLWDANTQTIYYLGDIYYPEYNSSTTRYRCSVIEIQNNNSNTEQYQSAVGYSDYIPVYGQEIRWQYGGVENNNTLLDYADNIQVNITLSEITSDYGLISYTCDGIWISMTDLDFNNNHESNLNDLRVMTPCSKIRVIDLWEGTNSIEPLIVYFKTSRGSIINNVKILDRYNTEITANTYDKFLKYRTNMSEQHTFIIEWTITNNTYSTSNFVTVPKDYFKEDITYFDLFINSDFCKNDFLDWILDKKGIDTYEMNDDSLKFYMNDYNTQLRKVDGSYCMMFPYNHDINLTSYITLDNIYFRNFTLTETSVSLEQVQDMIEYKQSLTNIETGCVYNDFITPEIFGFKFGILRDFNWVWCKIVLVVQNYSYSILLILLLVSYVNIRKAIKKI